MAETNIAETVVEYLSSQNVQHIFGVLAHTSFALGDAIAKRPHLRFVNSQHEGGAGNMALGYARVAKKPAVWFPRVAAPPTSSRLLPKPIKSRCRCSSSPRTSTRLLRAKAPGLPGMAWNTSGCLSRSPSKV